MILTNKKNLPEAIVEAVRNDGYSNDGADMSVTGLIKPTRMAALEYKHKDELTEDASDRIWSLMGQSIHTILERANKKGIAERRLSITIEGWKISGGMDLYDEQGVLTDYKTTSVWAVKKGVKSEWIAQLNMYAHILRKHGYAVQGLKIVALIRDWSIGEAWRDRDYPQSQVETFDIPMWPDEIAAHFMRERVILHQQARLSAQQGSTLPMCTPDERWQKPTVWAVMKKGAKRATKLYPNFGEADVHAYTHPDLTVVERPGQETRCLFYCGAAKFCEHRAQLIEPKGEES